MKVLSPINDPKLYWNGWTSNYLHSEQGYRVHMSYIGPDGRGSGSGRALCGAKIMEGGGLDLTEVEPGCIKCRNILRKRGLLK